MTLCCCTSYYCNVYRCRFKQATHPFAIQKSTTRVYWRRRRNTWEATRWQNATVHVNVAVWSTRKLSVSHDCRFIPQPIWKTPAWPTTLWTMSCITTALLKLVNQWTLYILSLTVVMAIEYIRIGWKPSCIVDNVIRVPVIVSIQPWCNYPSDLVAVPSCSVELLTVFGKSLVGWSLDYNVEWTVDLRLCSMFPRCTLVIQ